MNEKQRRGFRKILVAAMLVLLVIGACIGAASADKTLEVANNHAACGDTINPMSKGV